MCVNGWEGIQENRREKEMKMSSLNCSASTEQLMRERDERKGLFSIQIEFLSYKLENSNLLFPHQELFIIMYSHLVRGLNNNSRDFKGTISISTSTHVVYMLKFDK